MATVKSSNKIFGGVLTKYTHDSTSTNTSMVFSIFTPKSIESKPAGVLYWLSGLTCTDDNFAQKASPAFAAAAKNNMVIVMCDTSPRGANCPNDKESWDFGEGAGFYLNATNEAYSKHYNMYDYVTVELHNVVKSILGDVITDKRSISGHSMGGLGALNLYLKSNLYQSCSAFAPISHPMACPWGEKAFSNYLGEDKESWKQYDPTCLAASFAGDKTRAILIDQGSKDQFLTNGQLLPQDFIKAAGDAGLVVDYNEREGYDHSYFFITTFVEAHIEYHAKFLQ